MRKLRLKQEQFVNEYLKTGNATRAIIDSGYSVNYDSARAMGSRALTSANVKTRIEQVLIEQNITPAYVVDRLRDNLEQAAANKQFNASNQSIKLLSDFLGLSNEARQQDRLDNKTNQDQVNLSEYQADTLVKIYDAIGASGIKELLNIIDDSESPEQLPGKEEFESGKKDHPASWGGRASLNRGGNSENF